MTTDSATLDRCWQTPAEPDETVLAWLASHGWRPDRNDAQPVPKDWAARARRDAVNVPTIYVGMGTCGIGAGAEATRSAIQRYLGRTRRNAEIVDVGCIGLCSDEPLIDVQLPERTRLSFSRVTPEIVDELLDKLFDGVVPETHVLGQFAHRQHRDWDGVPFIEDHPFFARQRRCVLLNCGLVDPVRIDEYIARGGYNALAAVLRTHTQEQVCDAIEQSGLRGRGGGGFPTGTKWKIALSQNAEQRYLICNADEGDPGAFMDRAVIEGDPYRLLEGMTIAAYGIGANKAYVYIRAEYPLATKRLKTAIAFAHEYGLLGTNILDSGFSLDIVIKQGAGAFVCGEETALINSIEGCRGMPRLRPPYPAVEGLFGKPTVINNVETLANVPAIFTRGPEWFAGMGTKASKGTKVFALSGKVCRTGLIEVEMGTTLREVIFDIGGGIPNDREYKAVQIGGPSGGCIPQQHLDIQIDYESLKTVGAMMGSGGLVVMDEDTCMVDVAKFFMEFVQRESCGKCTPCREGTLRMLEVLQAITRGRRGEKGNDALVRFRGAMYLERLANVIKDTSLCGLGQSAPNPVLSTLRFFRDEYEAHIFERRCPAGVCQELRNFSIDEEGCTGCGVCKTKCPANAIVGIPQRIHYIVDDKCIGCGVCNDVCTHNAVKLATPEPVPAAAKESESSFQGAFSGNVFRGWHKSRRVLRTEQPRTKPGAKKD